MVGSQALSRADGSFTGLVHFLLFAMTAPIVWEIATSYICEVCHHLGTLKMQEHGGSIGPSDSFATCVKRMPPDDNNVLGSD